MTPPLKIDVHEPIRIRPLIQQVVPTTTESLNTDGYADYYWEGVDGPSQVERKKWTDLLGGLDKVEDLLRRQLQAHPEVRLKLLIEGIATPTMTGTQTWMEARGKRNLIVPAKSFKIPLSSIYAWENQISKFLEVTHTSNMLASVRAIVAFYNGDQQNDHQTMQRTLKVADFHPNPQVQKLMGVADGIGITRAEALIKRFGTCWHVLSVSDPLNLTVVHGIGVGLALKILRGAGRTDV